MPQPGIRGRAQDLWSFFASPRSEFIFCNYGGPCKCSLLGVPVFRLHGLHLSRVRGFGYTFKLQLPFPNTAQDPDRNGGLQGIIIKHGPLDSFQAFPGRLLAIRLHDDTRVCREQLGLKNSTQVYTLSDTYSTPSRACLVFPKAPVHHLRVRGLLEVRIGARVLALHDLPLAIPELQWCWGGFTWVGLYT